MRLGGGENLLCRTFHSSTSASQDPPMMAKPKPPLRLVLPTFQVARLITKATKDDATVTIPLHEFKALVAAAAKERL